MFSRICLFSLCLLTSGTLLAATRELELSRSAEDFAQLELDTGSGDLEVSGTAGSEVTARLELDFPGDWSDEEIQDFIDRHVIFEFAASGRTLELSAHLDQSFYDGYRGWPFWWGRNQRQFVFTLLEVGVPASLDLEIHDGSGDADISGIRGDLDVTDGSGNLLIEDSGGDVRVEDNSGNLDVRGVAGSLVVRDGSGNIDIRNVGAFTRIRDGSGNIDVTEIGGDLEIRDGSGRVSTSRITGSIDVRD
jgi:DUF4097 and DUF4098 domain-containing protein YvlB